MLINLQKNDLLFNRDNLNNVQWHVILNDSNEILDFVLYNNGYKDILIDYESLFYKNFGFLIFIDEVIVTPGKLPVIVFKSQYIFEEKTKVINGLPIYDPHTPSSDLKLSFIVNGNNLDIEFNNYFTKDKRVQYYSLDLNEYDINYTSEIDIKILASSQKNYSQIFHYKIEVNEYDYISEDNIISINNQDESINNMFLFDINNYFYKNSYSNFVNPSFYYYSNNVKISTGDLNTYSSNNNNYLISVSSPIEYDLYNNDVTSNITFSEYNCEVHWKWDVDEDGNWILVVSDNFYYDIEKDEVSTTDILLPYFTNNLIIPQSSFNEYGVINFSLSTNLGNIEFNLPFIMKSSILDNYFYEVDYVERFGSNYHIEIENGVIYE